MRREQGRQSAGGDPRLHRDREVVGIVFDHPNEAREVGDHVDTRRRVPELERVAASSRDDGQSLVVGEGHDAAQLVDRYGTHDPARRLAVDCRGRAGLVVSPHPLAAHDRDERFGDRASRDGHRASSRLRKNPTLDAGPR